MPPAQPTPLPWPPSHVLQSPKKVGEDIQKATMDWKGQNVTVRLTIVNRQATAEVVPSASALVIKALKEPPRDKKKVPRPPREEGGDRRAAGERKARGLRGQDDRMHTREGVAKEAGGRGRWAPVSTAASHLGVAIAGEEHQARWQH